MADQYDASITSFNQIYQRALGAFDVLSLQASHAKAAYDGLTELASAARPSVPIPRKCCLVDTLDARIKPCHPAVVAAIVRGGGTTSLVAIMDSFKCCSPDLSDICVRATDVCCDLLCQLALPYGGNDPAHDLVNSECADTVAAAGGATAVVAAMREHSAFDTIAGRGCNALDNISRKSVQAATSVVAAGGIVAVAAALRMHWASVHAPVARFAVQALTSMLDNVNHYGDITFIAPRIKEAIDDGCLPVLLAVLCSRRSDPIHQICVPLILRFFSESSLENCAAVVAAGGGEYITDPASASGVAVLGSEAGSAGGSCGGPHAHAGPLQA